MVAIMLNGKHLMEVPKCLLKLEDKRMYFNHGKLEITFIPDGVGEITESDLFHLKSLGVAIEDLVPFVKQQLSLEFADNSELIT